MNGDNLDDLDDLEAAFAAPSAKMGLELGIIAEDKKGGLSLAELADLVEKALQAGMDPRGSVVKGAVGWRGQVQSLRLVGLQVER